MPRSTNSHKLRQRGRGHNAKGRSKKGDRFVKLNHWMMASAAWCSLGPPPRALYVELARRYNGHNNGEISLSVREAARLLHIAKDTASKAFWELEAKGFVKRHVCGSFNWKLKHATTWILTAYEFGDEPATKEFARWRPERKNDGPISRTHCPGVRTPKTSIEHTWPSRVPDLGQWTLFRQFIGPNSRHAYSLPCHAQKYSFHSLPRAHSIGSAETPNIAALNIGCAPIGWPVSSLMEGSLDHVW